MISLDQSRGSGELAPMFAPFGIPINVTDMRSYGGDAWFIGTGPEGDVRVVVERKRITDLIACINDNRLKGFQLPLMQENYDRIYIIVEGLWRPSSDGGVEESRNGKWVPLNIMYRRVDNYLTSLSRNVDAVKRSCTPYETVVQIVDLYRYYETVHRHKQAVYAPSIPVRPGKVRMRKASWIEKFAYLMPGVDAKLEAVAKHFGSIDNAVRASQEEWMQIPGIGKVTAKNIRDAIMEDSRPKCT